MIVRVIIGVGLFALGYLVGKEIGRTESIREQLRLAAEGDDQMPARPDSESQTNQAPRPTDC